MFLCYILRTIGSWVFFGKFKQFGCRKLKQKSYFYIIRWLDSDPPLLCKSFLAPWSGDVLTSGVPGVPGVLLPDSLKLEKDKFISWWYTSFDQLLTVLSLLTPSHLLNPDHLVLPQFHFLFTLQILRGCRFNQSQAPDTHAAPDGS